ncbi:MAG TPA: phosphoribosylaminoimidazolesuccinocarboxamide synthase, partial [Pseudoxanthomonas sp.]|nr:phosphoribosylaminoimidazolesuccinocarboxamide synthase [Pseudoxanthomonas sp.]
MSTTPVRAHLSQSDLPGLPLRHRGKVRDVFDLPRERLPAAALSSAGATGDLLLMVATDRLSAFDVVLPDPVPGKGEMLCQLSNFWFEKTAHLMPNHLTGIDVASVLPQGVDASLYVGRSVVTRKLKPVPVEAIARGYLIGSGWKDYRRTGAVSGIALPDGLRQAEQHRGQRGSIGQRALGAPAVHHEHRGGGAGHHRQVPVVEGVEHHR